jgi:hypothetical protein
VEEHKTARVALIIVAGFAAVSALGGGLMVASGWPYQFPAAWLEGTPFPDYTLPGLILGVVVGGSALLATVALLKNVRWAALASIAAGAIMMGWIVGEIVLLNVAGFTWLWPLYFGVGLVMALLGLRLAPFTSRLPSAT